MDWSAQSARTSCAVPTVSFQIVPSVGTPGVMKS